MKQSDRSGKSVPQAGMEGDTLTTQKAAGGKGRPLDGSKASSKMRGKQVGMSPAGGKGARPPGAGGKRVK